MIIGSKIYQDSLKNFQIMISLMGSEEGHSILMIFLFGGGGCKVYCEAS